MTSCMIGQSGLYRSLEVLHLRRTVQIYQAEGIRALVYFPNLVALDLRYAKGITDEGLRELSLLNRLRELNLEACREISAKGLGHLTSLRNLKDLNVAFVDDYPDKSEPAVPRVGHNRLLSWARASQFIGHKWRLCMLSQSASFAQGTGQLVETL